MEGSGRSRSRSRKGRAGPAAGRPGKVFAAERPPLESGAGGPRLLPAGGSLPRHPLSRPSGPEQRGSPVRVADCWGPRTEPAKAQRPGERRAALATVGMRARHGRGLASITTGLPRPPCWEETTRHAASERLQRRKRWRWLVLPALSGRRRRQGAEGCAGGAELQLYGGPAGPRRLPRSAGGVGCGAQRASCRGAAGALAPVVGLCPPGTPALTGGQDS